MMQVKRTERGLKHRATKTGAWLWGWAGSLNPASNASAIQRRGSETPPYKKRQDALLKQHRATSDLQRQRDPAVGTDGD